MAQPVFSYKSEIPGLQRHTLWKYCALICSHGKDLFVVRSAPSCLRVPLQTKQGPRTSAEGHLQGSRPASGGLRDKSRFQEGGPRPLQPPPQLLTPCQPTLGRIGFNKPSESDSQSFPGFGEVLLNVCCCQEPTCFPSVPCADVWFGHHRPPPAMCAPRT